MFSHPPKVCPVCSETFTPKRPEAVYCSPVCRHRASYDRRSAPVPPDRPVGTKDQMFVYLKAMRNLATYDDATAATWVRSVKGGVDAWRKMFAWASKVNAHIDEWV